MEARSPIWNSTISYDVDGCDGEHCEKSGGGCEYDPGPKPWASMEEPWASWTGEEALHARYFYRTSLGGERVRGSTTRNSTPILRETTVATNFQLEDTDRPISYSWIFFFTHLLQLDITANTPADYGRIRSPSSVVSFVTLSSSWISPKQCLIKISSQPVMQPS